MQTGQNHRWAALMDVAAKLVESWHIANSSKRLGFTCVGDDVTVPGSPNRVPPSYGADHGAKMTAPANWTNLHGLLNSWLGVTSGPPDISNRQVGAVAFSATARTVDEDSPESPLGSMLLPNWWSHRKLK